MVLRKSFYIRWSAGRSPRVHEVNPGRDPSDMVTLGSIEIVYLSDVIKCRNNYVLQHIIERI